MKEKQQTHICEGMNSQSKALSHIVVCTNRNCAYRPTETVSQNGQNFEEYRAYSSWAIHLLDETKYRQAKMLKSPIPDKCECR